MPLEFMYSSRLKLRMTACVRSPHACAYASVRAVSLPAVTSPRISMMLMDALGARTSMSAVASGIPVPFVGGRCVRLICVQGNEVGEARDLEDLAVVVGEAAGGQAAPLGSRTAEQSDDQRDPGRVDVLDVREVE